LEQKTIKYKHTITMRNETVLSGIVVNALIKTSKCIKDFFKLILEIDILCVKSWLFHIFLF